MRILFCVEMFYPIVGVVNSFLAFLYLYLSLAVNFSFYRERVREQAYDIGTTLFEEREKMSSYATLLIWFIWKHDTFVTHPWGSLKYDKGLI